MNTDELIEQIHAANRQRRQAEHGKGGSHRLIWRIAVPAAAAAAILLVVLLPREKADGSSSGNQTYASAGIYCNSQCNPDDVLALIDNNINHIKAIQSL